MECVKGGDLKLLIQEGLKIDKNCWRKMAAPHYALQVIKAVEFLHQQSTIHADLKPENVLVTHNGRLQLADFGSAFQFQNNEMSQSAPDESNPKSSEAPVLGGTTDYASPEILKGTPASELGIATDLWSLGCILGALQWGQSPFHAASDALALDSIMNYGNGTAIPPLLDKNREDENLPKGWKKLIMGFLTPTPELRVGVDRCCLSGLLPGNEDVDLTTDPPFLPPEPKWVQESKTHTMANGSRGWSAFLL